MAKKDAETKEVKKVQYKPKDSIFEGLTYSVIDTQAQVPTVEYKKANFKKLAFGGTVVTLVKDQILTDKELVNFNEEAKERYLEKVA